MANFNRLLSNIPARLSIFNFPLGFAACYQRDARIFNLLKCLPHFVPMPPLLRSNACSYIVQGISTTHSRHPTERQQAPRQSAAVFPTPLPHTNQVGTLRVAALQSIMKPYFTPHLYLYLYIYKYIYKYKIFLWYLLLLGKQLQHCNAARNCAKKNSRWDRYLSHSSRHTQLPATTPSD